MAAAIGWLSLGRPDLTQVLDRLQVPSLLTTGEHDPMWTVASARAASAHLANGALVILPAAGHVGPILQAAPAVIELVGAFWSDPAATIARHRTAPAPTSRPPALTRRARR
jgi:pimeloyl-ACP methyl ester carboxylesterase